MLNLLGIDIATWIIIIVLGIVVLIELLSYLPLFTWLHALLCGVHINFGKLINMRFRKININTIVKGYIRAKKAKLDIDINDLELLYLGKGNVIKVVNALIAAHKSDINLSTKTAMAIDLAGRDVLNTDIQQEYMKKEKKII